MSAHKRLKKVVMVIAIIIGICGLGFLYLYNSTTKKPIKSNQDMVGIEVKAGEGLYDILNRMDREGKLNNKFLIKLYLSVNKTQANIPEGIYEVKSDLSLPELLETLESDGKNSNTIKITIPEGYTIDQIADLLQKNDLCTKEKFIDAVNSYDIPDFIEEKDDIIYKLEGFLYPDTYLIPVGTDANQIIEMMVSRFKEVLEEVELETGKTIEDKDIFKLITKASLVEKEASSDEDRPLVSSVIDNRIAKGMELKIDAAIIYALREHVDVVLNKHLKIDSPYNIYKNKGLPVGPIASPGKQSIIAALNPASTDYLFYLLIPNTNTHYFTNSDQDFAAKRKEYGYDGI